MSTKEKTLLPIALKKLPRWLKILLIALAAVLVLIALGPTIVSTSPFRKLALRQINQRINGRLSIDSWSIGWFTGVDIQGLSLEDEDSEPVAEIKNLSLNPSYFSLLGQNPRLGKINLGSLRLDIRFDRQWHTSLEKIAAPSRGPASPSSTQPSFDLQITEGVVRIHRPDAPPLSIHNIDASVQVSPSGQPVSFKLNCDLTDARGQGKIEAEGTIPRRDDGGFVPELVKASAKVSVKQLGLRLLSPLLQRAGLKLETAGLLDLRGHVRMDGLENIKLECQANSADIRLTGKLFKSDELHLRDFSLSAQAHHRDTLLTLDELILASDLINIQTSGTMHLASTDKLPELGSARLDGRLSADLPKILNQLPATLHLQPELKITGGDLIANYTITTADGSTQLIGTAALQNMQGSTPKRNIQLDEPVEFSFDLVRTKEQDLQIRRISANSGFGSLSATGKANDLTLQADLDLAKLNIQLARFIDLGDSSFAGQLLCDAKLTTAPRHLDFQLDLTGTDLFLHGLTPRDLREPQIRLNLQGSLTLAQDKQIAAVSIERAQLLADETQLQFAGSCNLQPLTVSGRMQLETDLSRANSYLSQFIDLGKLDLAGQLLCNADITTQDRRLNCQADLTATDLFITGLARRDLREPHLQLILDGSLTRTDNNQIAALSFKQAQFLTERTQLQFSGQIDPKPLAVTGQIKLKSDLSTLQTYLAQFADLGKLDLDGQLLCNADITTQDHRINFLTELTADNLLIAGLAQRDLREPHLRLILDGSLTRTENNQIAALSFKQAQLLTDRTELQFSGQIDPKPLAVTGQAQITADLARLQELTLAFGSSPQDFQLQGTLDSALTFAAPRPQIIACDGATTLQDLRITYEDGRTLLEPRVTLEHKLLYDLNSRTLDGELPQLKLAGLTARFQKLTLARQPDGKFDIHTQADFQGDLRRLNPWLVTFAKLDPKTELAGQLAGQASYSRQTQQESFTLDSQILNLKLRPPGRPVFAEPKISLQIEGSADRAAKTLELSRLDVSSDFLQVNAQVTTGLSSPASPAKITLQVHSDLQRLSRVMQPWFSNWPELTGSGSANMTLTGTPGSTDWLASLSGPAALHIDRQELAGVTLGPADIDMHVKQGLLTIPPSTIPANKGKINFQAQVSLARTKPFLVISQPINLVEDVQINAQMSNALLKFINPVFADNHQVSGTVSFICNHLLIDDPAKWRQTAKMKGLFSGKDLLFQPRKGIMADLASILDLDLSSKLGELRPVSIELSDGVVSYKDMHIVFSHLLDLSFSGQVGLDESISMRVGIPILPSMLGNRPELIKFLADQRIYLPITGTLSKPRLDVAAFPGLLLEQISRVLRNQAAREVGKILEGILKPIAPPPP